jgi:hypothetical protein
MVREYITTRMSSGAWLRPIPVITIPDTPPTSDAESDFVPWWDGNEDESIDYTPAGPEVEALAPEASDEDDVQVI